MSYFLTLSAFAGDDLDTAAKKLALMFRMAPQQASTILEKISKGQVWQTPQAVSDKQASVAENYLTALGFQVERSGEQEVVDQISESATFEEESENQSAQPQATSASTAAAIPNTSPPGSNGLPIGFHGTGGGLFKIMLINWILTILTLGIYSFWGKTKVRRYLCEHSSFAGDRFHYHGTGGELFKGAVIFGLMFSAYNTIAYAIGQVWGTNAQAIAEASGGILIIFLLPVIMVGAFRYRLSRTAWRGIRFSFRGTRKGALWLYIRGMILMVLTLYLYWPYFLVRMQKFWRDGAHFGSQSFKYDGKGGEIMKAFLLMVLLYLVCMVAVPLSLPELVPGIDNDMVAIVYIVMFIPLMVGFLWYTVFLDRYHWAKTEFAGGRFNYDATAWQWFLLNFTNFLIIVLTLGFGIPFATVRSRQFLADHLSVVGNMQLSQVVQEAQQSSALGEGAADGFDMDIDIGI